LRDTLLTALQAYTAAGPRNIIKQLCLAVSGFMLQVPSWDKPVQTMIDTFGRDATTVPTLLEFLTLLPEEIAGNTRIPVTDQEFRERSADILTNNATKVLELLSIYVNASGVTPAVQSQVFECLYSWLVAGEIAVADFAETPLFTYAFEALASEDLFDAAVDVICQMIHETQEIEDNMLSIQLIVPRVIALRSAIAKDREDPEKIKGYARIFSEAGETYRSLVIQHTESFFPLVEAIGECSAYPDLDIVPITFPFWMRLAQMLGKKSEVPRLFVDAYKALMGVIITHLHFPADLTTLTGQEADNFRSFRHVMGDTLKDCCFVLRTETCLSAAYQLISNALAHGTEVSWQEIEAPLFAMRSMGAEVDPEDNDIVPKIIDLIPALPNHPRVRYAALLIISRYSEWIANHPSYIQPQLAYIAAGFEDTDGEVSAAAGQALKYVCQDCRQHLTEFLPTLHSFLTTTGTKLVQDDKRQVYEAIGHVISAMPMNAAADALKTFSLDILAQVHTLASKSTPPTKAEIETVGDGLENLEVMLTVVQSWGEELPASCRSTCQETWTIFDALLANYGLNYDLSERATRVLRRGLDIFSNSALHMAPSVLNRMSLAFEATGFPSFLWIAGKVMGRFSNEIDPALKSAIKEILERSTAKVASLLHVKSPGEIPDVLEDYVQMLLQYLSLSPEILFGSSAFSLAFRCAMMGLTVIHTDIVFATLDLFRGILTHDCLESRTAGTPAKYAPWAAAIQDAMNKEGQQFVAYILNGFVSDFPEDGASTVVSIFRALASGWPQQLLVWLPPILERLPAATIPNESKAKFLQDVTTTINSRQFDRIKSAVLAFDRASRKARDRRRAQI
jgi:transportin-3